MSSLEDDYTSPKRGRVYSDAFATRKALTPDLSHTPNHTHLRGTMAHKRNSSDTFVNDVTSSLTFEVSPPIIQTSDKNSKYSPPSPSSDHALDTPTLMRAAPDTPTFNRVTTPTHDKDTPIVITKDTPTFTIAPPPTKTDKQHDTTDDVHEEGVAIDKMGVVSSEINSVSQITKQQMSVLFRQELLSVVAVKSDTDIAIDILSLSNTDVNMIDLLSKRLPEVIQNTLLPKREVSESVCVLV